MKNQKVYPDFFLYSKKKNLVLWTVYMMRYVKVSKLSSWKVFSVILRINF